MKKIFPILIISFLLTSCGRQAIIDEKPIVFSSFYAMDSFVGVIGGEDIVCQSVVPVGAEPHDFEPSAKDMAMLNNADAFVYEGSGIDDWAKDIIGTLPETVEVLQASAPLSLYLEEGHTWLSFENARIELRMICDLLSDIDEKNKEKYNTRLEEYLAQLDEIEQEYKNAGLEGKKLFVTHGAYAYLCYSSGMEQISLEGISGESDPSPAQTAEFVERIKAEGARTIFYDPLEGDKLANAVAAEAGIEALPLYTFEGDTQNRDYVTVMKSNLEQLKKGL